MILISLHLQVDIFKNYLLFQHFGNLASRSWLFPINQANARKTGWRGWQRGRGWGGGGRWRWWGKGGWGCNIYIGGVCVCVRQEKGTLALADAVRYQNYYVVLYCCTTCISWEIGSYNIKQSRQNEHTHFWRKTTHFCRETTHFCCEITHFCREINFCPKVRGGSKGRLELFRKFIRFGSVQHP